jgi:hypothetical protein
LDEKELASVTYRVTTDVMHYAIHPQIDRDLAVHQMFHIGLDGAQGRDLPILLNS